MQMEVQTRGQTLSVEIGRIHLIYLLWMSVEPIIPMDDGSAFTVHLNRQMHAPQWLDSIVSARSLSLLRQIRTE